MPLIGSRPRSSQRQLRWAAALLTMLIPFTVSAAALETLQLEPIESTAFGLDDLAALLQREGTATATFHELQYRRVLKEPLVRSGELYFEPPGRFEKRVTAPVTETYRIDGDTLSMQLPNRNARQISLRNQPLLGGLLLGFKAVISGRLDSLDRTFATTVSGSAASWRLELRPLQPEVARYIAKIQISGRASQLLRYEVLEHSGDRTVTDIDPR